MILMPITLQNFVHCSAPNLEAYGDWCDVIIYSIHSATLSSALMSYFNPTEYFYHNTLLSNITQASCVLLNKILI